MTHINAIQLYNVAQQQKRNVKHEGTIHGHLCCLAWLWILKLEKNGKKKEGGGTNNNCTRFCSTLLWIHGCSLLCFSLSRLFELLSVIYWQARLFSIFFILFFQFLFMFPCPSTTPYQHQKLILNISMMRHIFQRQMLSSHYKRTILLTILSSLNFTNFCAKIWRLPDAAAAANSKSLLLPLMRRFITGNTESWERTQSSLIFPYD